MSQPPYDPNQPPYQPAGWQPPPPAKPKAPLVLGILIGAVAPFLGFVPAILLGDVAEIFQLSPFVWSMIVLATGAGLLFSDRTRRWGLGILIGFFGMLIIGAGLCVAVLVVVLASYSGG